MNKDERRTIRFKQARQKEGSLHEIVTGMSRRVKSHAFLTKKYTNKSNKLMLKDESPRHDATFQMKRDEQINKQRNGK